MTKLNITHMMCYGTSADIAKTEVWQVTCTLPKQEELGTYLMFRCLYPTHPGPGTAQNYAVWYRLDPAKGRILRMPKPELEKRRGNLQAGAPKGGE